MAPDKIESLSTGEMGQVAVGKQHVRLPFHRNLAEWLRDEIAAEQTLMQFTGYCLLVGR